VLLYFVDLSELGGATNGSDSEADNQCAMETGSIQAVGRHLQLLGLHT